MTHKTPLFLGGFVVLALVAALLVFGRSGGGALDRSVIGMGGLQQALKQQGVEARVSHPRQSPQVGDLGLRVLPLYTTFSTDIVFFNRDERMKFFGSEARPINREVLLTKLSELPSLVILPKWVTGTIEREIATEQLLIDRRAYERLFAQLDLPELEVQRGAPAMDTRDGVSLFLPQTLAPESLPETCRALRQFGGGVLLAQCRIDEEGIVFYLLSDPDLLNNHGLAVGDNIKAAAEMVSALTPEGGRPVYIDNSSELLISVDSREERRDYTRDASDFERFLTPPFTALWLVAFAILALLLWRGAVRFGPPEIDTADRPEQSKAEAVATTARLLRLSGHDGEMIAEFVRQQLTERMRQALGMAGGGQGLSRYFAYLARRDASVARAFERSARLLMEQGAALPRAQLFAELATYRSLLEKLTDADESH